MKENKIKKDVNELSDENLESASGGLDLTGMRLNPDKIRIGNDPSLIPGSYDWQKKHKNLFKKVNNQNG